MATASTPGQTAMALITAACHRENYGEKMTELLDATFKQALLDTGDAQAAMDYICAVMVKLVGACAIGLGGIAEGSGRPVEEYLTMLATSPFMQAN